MYIIHRSKILTFTKIDKKRQLSFNFCKVFDILGKLTEVASCRSLKFKKTHVRSRHL